MGMGPEPDFSEGRLGTRRIVGCRGQGLRMMKHFDIRKTLQKLRL